MLLAYDAAAITQEPCWDQDAWEKLETDTAANTVSDAKSVFPTTCRRPVTQRQ